MPSIGGRSDRWNWTVPGHRRDHRRAARSRHRHEGHVSERLRYRRVPTSPGVRFLSEAVSRCRARPSQRHHLGPAHHRPRLYPDLIEMQQSSRLCFERSGCLLVAQHDRCLAFALTKRVALSVPIRRQKFGFRMYRNACLSPFHSVTFTGRGMETVFGKCWRNLRFSSAGSFVTVKP